MCYGKFALLKSLLIIENVSPDLTPYGLVLLFSVIELGYHWFML